MSNSEFPTTKSKKRKISADLPTADNPNEGRLKIPDEILEWAQENKLSGSNFKWLRASDFYQNQGYHPEGWQIFRDKSGTIKSEFGLGSDPEGVVRRGDLLLGIKSNDAIAKLKNYNRMKAERQSLNKVYERQAADLRQTAGSSGVKIHAGLDSNDE